MLSYQHSFHAGNHADVLKHLTLLALLEKLQQKQKPFFYLDTHAGNGCYELPESTQDDKGKYDQLMASSLSAKKANGNSIIKQYQSVIKSYIEKGMYPGSPLILEVLKRDIDNMHVNELHPQAFAELAKWLKRSKIHSHKRDAFELLNALTPPKPNRGMVLIDPPYEQAQEYQQVVDAVTKAVHKWPQGIFAVWYPLLSPMRLNRNTKAQEINPKSGMSEDMLAAFSKIAVNGLLNVKFVLQAPSDEMGMYGSGLAIINPPWQIDETLKGIVEAMESQLKTDSNTLSGVEWLVNAR